MLSQAPLLAFSGERWGSGSGAGDVNGDGYADILVGSPGYGTGGRVSIFFGNPAL